MKARRAATADRKKLSKSLEKSARNAISKAKFAWLEAVASTSAHLANMMIWPEGLWYMKVTKTDVPQIVDTYLKLEESGQAKEVGAAAKVARLSELVDSHFNFLSIKSRFRRNRVTEKPRLCVGRGASIMRSRALPTQNFYPYWLQTGTSRKNFIAEGQTTSWQVKHY